MTRANLGRPNPRRYDGAALDQDRLREMREHVGVDPHDVLRHPEQYNRADRRLAAKVKLESTHSTEVDQ